MQIQRLYSDRFDVEKKHIIFSYALFPVPSPFPKKKDTRGKNTKSGLVPISLYFALWYSSKRKWEQNICDSVRWDV